jgi:hypothetical protein
VQVTQVRINRKGISGRPYAFNGIRLSDMGLKYKNGAIQSNQSSLSDILLKNEFCEKIDKMGKTLDSLDSLDQNADLDKV